MLTVNTQAQLVDLIMTIARLEKASEAIRLTLAEQPCFLPYSSFQRIDRKHNGYITGTEIMQFLE